MPLSGLSCISREIHERAVEVGDWTTGAIGETIERRRPPDAPPCETVRLRVSGQGRGRDTAVTVSRHSDCMFNQNK
jgi:hypothetical protein